MRDPNGNEGRRALAGILAILMWAIRVAAARRVGEEIGVLAAATAANLPGGSLACLLGFLRHCDTRRLFRLPREYLVGCGLLFVLYNLVFYSAPGESAVAAGFEEGLVHGCLSSKEYDHAEAVIFGSMACGSVFLDPSRSDTLGVAAGLWAPLRHAPGRIGRALPASRTGRHDDHGPGE